MKSGYVTKMVDINSSNKKKEYNSSFYIIDFVRNFIIKKTHTILTVLSFSKSVDLNINCVPYFCKSMFCCLLSVAAFQPKHF